MPRRSDIKSEEHKVRAGGPDDKRTAVALSNDRRHWTVPFPLLHLLAEQFLRLHRCGTSEKRTMTQCARPDLGRAVMHEEDTPSRDVLRTYSDRCIVGRRILTCPMPGVRQAPRSAGCRDPDYQFPQRP